jgi:hypothetical protein
MNISTLEGYVAQRNSWNKMFGQKELSLLNSADRQRIANMIDCDLSPENLTCDGELRGEALRHKHRQLTRAAKELQSIDPNVEFFEYGC